MVSSEWRWPGRDSSESHFEWGVQLRYFAAIIAIAIAVALVIVVSDGVESIAKRVFDVRHSNAKIVGFIAGGVGAVLFLDQVRRWALRTFKSCPKCKSYIRSTASRCVYCRVDLDT